MPPQFGLKSFFGFGGKNKVNPNDLQRKRTLRDKDRDPAERRAEKERRAKAPRKDGARADENSIKDDGDRRGRQDQLTEQTQ